MRDIKFEAREKFLVGHVMLLVASVLVLCAVPPTALIFHFLCGLIFSATVLFSWGVSLFVRSGEFPINIILGVVQWVLNVGLLFHVFAKLHPVIPWFPR